MSAAPSEPTEYKQVPVEPDDITLTRYMSAMRLSNKANALQYWRAMLAAAPSEPVKYGCHCDLEEHMQPDGCVLDENRPEACVYARKLLQEGRGRDDCEYWRPITFSPSEPEQKKLSAEDVQWVVNSIAELGVKIGNQFFFLYKGHSLVYDEYDDGEPLYWRPVGKREFGECCHPINHKDYTKHGTVSLDDSDEWKLLPTVEPERAAARKK